MALNAKEIEHLGAAAGNVTAAGAFQRLEQAVSNFRNRNDATEEETKAFREACEIQFNRDVADKFEDLVF